MGMEIEHSRHDRLLIVQINDERALHFVATEATVDVEELPSPDEDPFVLYAGIRDPIELGCDNGTVTVNCYHSVITA